MWRRVILAGLAAALCVGTWGGVLASAMCAEGWHISGADASCCPHHDDQDDQARGGHEGQSHHAQPSETTHSCDDATRAASNKEDVRARRALSKELRREQTGSCAHCLSRSEERPATLAVRAPGQKSRDGDLCVPSVGKFDLAHTSSFVQPVIPKQCSPPVAPSRRLHLLNVFLI